MTLELVTGAEQCLKPVDDKIRRGRTLPIILKALKQGRRWQRRSGRYDPCSP